MGLPYSRLRERCRDAELLLNISGILTDPELVQHVPVRAYLDLDPAFNQLWHDSGIDMRFGAHNHFVTVGQAIGTPECPVPTCGLDWIPTVPPVVLERWPAAEGPGDGSFTTVGNWRGYGSVEQDGVQYGQKVHSMRLFMELPQRTDARFRLALGIHPDERPDLEALAQNGWELVDPAEVAGTPGSLRALHRRLHRGARDRKERLRALALRLVQRSQRLLPGLRPAGARAGDRLQQVPARPARACCRSRPSTTRSQASRRSAALTGVMPSERASWPRNSRLRSRARQAHGAARRGVVSAVPTDELRTALEPVLGREIESLERRPCAYRTSMRSRSWT